MNDPPKEETQRSSGGFLMVPWNILQCTKIKELPDKIVLACLVWKMNPTRKHAWPSIPWMRDHLGISAGTIRRSIRRLKKLGFITVDRYFAKRVNGYVVCLDQLDPAKAKAKQAKTLTPVQQFFALAKTINKIPKPERIAIFEKINTQLVSLGIVVDFRDPKTVHAMYAAHADTVHPILMSALSPKETICVPANDAGL